MPRYLAVLCLALAICIAAPAGAGPVSPRGVELVDYTIQAPRELRVGSRVTVSFTLRNAGQAALQFSPRYGIAVGARWIDPGGGVHNRDFGWSHQKLVLRPGRSVRFSASKVLDRPGKWRFWPAYQLAAVWGPFDAASKTLYVKAIPPARIVAAPGAAGAGGPVSSQGIQLKSFKVQAKGPVRVGQMVTISFVLKNVSGQKLNFGAGGIFVACRLRSGGRGLNRDFGYQYRNLKLAPGQEVQYRIIKTITEPGQWSFWPGFKVAGRWSPYDRVRQMVSASAPGRAPAAMAGASGGGATIVIGPHGKKLPLQVFPPDNPWNQDVSKLPLHPQSKTFIASMGGHLHLHPDFGARWQGRTIGIPYTVVRRGQFPAPVKFRYRAESDRGPYPIPPNVAIEGSGDRHAIVLDYDAKKLYELFELKRARQGWQAGSGAIFDLTSNRLRPLGWTSADAAGLPIFPGLVRPEEVFDKGRIDHALRFTTPRTFKGYIKPATHYASPHTNPAIPPMGLRLRLKASFDISRFPYPVKVILAALKKYGMILSDNGGPWFISGSPSQRWDNEVLSALKRVKGRDFEVVYTGEVMR